MEELRYDIVVVGMGLGAAAIAWRLRETAARIVMVPGVGCARFKHLDGGVISPGELQSAFGTAVDAPIHQRGKSFTFRRDQLEAWAIERVRPDVEMLEDFADLRVGPHTSGDLALYEEAGRRVIVARLIVLTEGASPKIGIAARIRPDFEPEDLLHFGRAILSGAELAMPAAGTWRTSWNMPGWYSAIPHPDGVIIGASARIENIMRSARDGRDVLRDFLQSPIAAGMGLPPTALEVGMELVPLRPAATTGMTGTHGMIISPDADGTIDPRLLDRFSQVLGSGAAVGEAIVRGWPHTSDWSEPKRDLANMFTSHRTPYHDSSETGFIEDGVARSRGFLRTLLKR